MTGTKNKAVTTNPDVLRRVSERKELVRLCMGKYAVPIDAITPAALLDYAVEMWEHDLKQTPEYVSRMLKEYAETHYLYRRNPEGNS